MRLIDADEVMKLAEWVPTEVGDKRMVNVLFLDAIAGVCCERCAHPNRDYEPPKYTLSMDAPCAMWGMRWNPAALCHHFKEADNV